ncbi:hypothetical protein [Geothrix mesophila]|uniref:hypothetical protein n=1 Tax=Geothrix mesophila TaxID=2922723 RepID=UPI001FAD3366|nr:hypothetical protein [Geothrix sp. SG198]
MLTIEVPLVRVRKGRCVEFTEHKPESKPKEGRASAAARALALGHRIVRAVETGEVRDFTDAARVMGVSQPRVSMLVGLTFLAPDIQEEVLLDGTRRNAPSTHQLLHRSRLNQWEEQRRFLRCSRTENACVES